MDIAAFATERYFEDYEFSCPHHVSASDCESMSVGELLVRAGRDPAELAALGLGYTESRGSPELRELVARQHAAVDPEHVVALAALEEGSAGARGWSLDLERMRAAIAATRPRLVVVNVPHNPTGWLPSHVEHEALVRFRRVARPADDAVAPSRTSPRLNGTSTAFRSERGNASRSRRTRTALRGERAHSHARQRHARAIRAERAHALAPDDVPTAFRGARVHLAPPARRRPRLARVASSSRGC